MEIFSEAPPSCNTGAQNTERDGLTSCVDWLGVTFKNVQDVQIICDLLGIEISNFKESKVGGMGYMKSTRFGGIAIYFEGRKDMGIHVEMSGQGCRHFEKYSSSDWITFFRVIVLLEINVTRLDLAVDDYKGYFTLKQVREKIRRKCVKSRFKDAIEMKKTRLATGESRGETVYFGSGKSMIQIRFYDKLLEREEAGKIVDEHITFWQRTEIQMRDERAMSAILILINEVENLGQFICGTLKNYLNFLVEDKDKNKARWKVCKWWDKFLGDVDKISLTIKQPDNTIERSHDWMTHQVETSMAMLYEAFEEDMTLFADLIQSGKRRLEDKHYDIINRFKSENVDINYEEFRKKQQKKNSILKKQN